MQLTVVKLAHNGPLFGTSLRKKHTKKITTKIIKDSQTYKKMCQQHFKNKVFFAQRITF